MLKKSLKIFVGLLSSLILLLGGLAYINPVITENTDIALANPKTWYNTPQTEPLTAARAVFLGDSITNGYAVDKHFPTSKLDVVASGINGEKSYETIQRLDEEFYALNPQKIFLLIGINNLTEGKFTPVEVAESIKEIVTQLKTNLPYTEIYVESLYPVNKVDFKTEKAKKMLGLRDNDTIKAVNQELIRVTRETQTTYIDVYPYLLDNKGQLKKEFSIEGLHLTEAGYTKVSEVLLPYLEN